MELKRYVFYIFLLLVVYFSHLEGARRNSRRDTIASLQTQLRALEEAQEEVRGQLSDLQSSVKDLASYVTAGLPEDCWAARARGSRRRVVMIKPPGLAPREAVCEPAKEGGGWTVVLRRYPTTTNHTERENFNRTWSDYRRGFGDLHGEFWIGNEVLHALTSQEPHQLHVSLKDWKGNAAVGVWNHFKVAGETERYRLSVGGYQASRSTTGDSFHHHHHHTFSTYDQDNDGDNREHCAKQYGGGWWYFSCHTSHLTGAAVTPGEGGHHAITWRSWPPSRTIGLQSATMMIRPLTPDTIVLDAAAVCPSTFRP